MYSKHLVILLLAYFSGSISTVSPAVKSQQSFDVTKPKAQLTGNNIPIVNESHQNFNSQIGNIGQQNKNVFKPDISLPSKIFDDEDFIEEIEEEEDDDYNDDEGVQYSNVKTTTKGPATFNKEPESLKKGHINEQAHNLFKSGISSSSDVTDNENIVEEYEEEEEDGEDKEKYTKENSAIINNGINVKKNVQPTISAISLSSKEENNKQVNNLSKSGIPSPNITSLNGKITEKEFGGFESLKNNKVLSPTQNNLMKSTIDTKFNKVQEEIPAKYVPALNFVQDLIKENTIQDGHFYNFGEKNDNVSYDEEDTSEYYNDNWLSETSDDKSEHTKNYKASDEKLENMHNFDYNFSNKQDEHETWAENQENINRYKIIKKLLYVLHDYVSFAFDWLINKINYKMEEELDESNLTAKIA